MGATAAAAGPRPAPGAAGTRARTLGERLRTETAVAHAGAERAFALPQRLRSPRDYADALLVLHAFAVAGELRLWALSAALPASLRDGPARRRARLRADLADLGRPLAGEPAPVPAGPPPPPAAAATERDRALGLLYVHEGAALGGLRIAAEVRRMLPSVHALGATRFLTGEGRATAARWRAVQGVLTAWAPADSPAGDRVVDGASAAFAAFTELMAAGR